jgi:hypothetical protein
MANPVSGITTTQQVPETTHAYQPPKQNGASKGGATEDTVTISSAGSAASQTKAATQNQKGADADHDGK